MYFSRRLFVASLTQTGCALGFAPLLMAKEDASVVTAEGLRREISSYGDVTALAEHGQRVEVQVLIREIEKLPRACEAFSREGVVHASGNDLRFIAGHRRIHIRHRV